MAVELYSHNMTAYTSAAAMMETAGKAAVIHPTGTGKSFIGFKYAEEHSQENILWLTPSDYIVKTQLENLKNAGGTEFANITFVTYAKLMVMTAEELAELVPGAIICDEYHRAGAAKWQEGFARLIAMYPNAKLLGLSATNIRYLDNQRDMAEELFDGNIASEMTLGEAIVLGILPAPKYVVSVFAYQKELRKYEDRIDKITNTGVREKSQKELEELRRTLEMADGLDVVFKKNMTEPHGKYVAFCANVEHMKEMISHVGEWFGAVDPDMHIYEVYSDNPTASVDFEEFKADNADTLRILFCIDMLNEGVHVEDIDGVVLFRPTVSPIIYKQQIGRALAVGKKKTPMIFDIVNNFENLYSIGTIQDEIDLAVSYYRDHGEGNRIVTDTFEIIDETRDSKRLFDILENSLNSTWEIYFRAAKAYYNKHGNLNVPKKYVTEDGLTLGVWLVTQRRVKRGSVGGILTGEQISRLENIGMVWDDMRGLQWERGFEHAKAYFEEHGDLDVKAQYVCGDGYKLGRWISNNRSWYVNRSFANVLTGERVKRLESIGMTWRKSNSVWERYYSAAADYHKKYGHINIPVGYVDEDGLKLGEWLNRQKQIKKGNLKKAAPLTEEQIERLDMLGMVWENKHEKQWNDKYEAAKEYYHQHGDLNVPVGYKTADGTLLGRWIGKQRTNNKLTVKQRELLSRIGMIWSKGNSWEERFALAKRYYDEHGDLNIPPQYVVNNIWLGKWVYEQRKGKAQLSPKQISRLEDIGMDWRSNAERMWDKNYVAAKRYYAAHGDVNIPQSYKTADGETLGLWIYRQRRSIDRLSKEQIQKLKQVGVGTD